MYFIFNYLVGVYFFLIGKHIMVSILNTIYQYKHDFKKLFFIIYIFFFFMAEVLFKF